MANIAIYSSTLHDSGDLIIYFSLDGKRVIAQLGVDGDIKMSRTIPSQGLELFAYLPNKGNDLLCAFHACDTYVMTYPWQGRGKKTPLTPTLGPDGLGSVVFVRHIDGFIYIARCRGGFDRFDGTSVERIQKGLRRVPQPSSSILSDVVQGWGGDPCTLMEKGVFRFSGGEWQHVAKVTRGTTRALAFDSTTQRLCLVGQSISFISEDGQEERFDIGDADYWKAVVHQGTLFVSSYSDKLHWVDADGSCVPMKLDDCYILNNNPGLHSASNGLWIATTECVYFLPNKHIESAKKGDANVFQRIWDGSGYSLPTGR
ncbi:MAG: hypothetical protein JKY56_27880 [Kofleriaceae bacterium]|nr:hypothetical protein [Kofleriaceae bacterium]